MTDHDHDHSPAERSTDSGPAIYKMGLAHIFLIAMLLAALYGVFKIIQPYLHAIILAALISSIFHPVYSRLVVKTKGRENLASGLTCVLVALLVIVPMMLCGAALAQRGMTAFTKIKAGVEDGTIEEFFKSEKVQKIVMPPLHRLKRLKEKYAPDMVLDAESIRAMVLEFSALPIDYMVSRIIPFIKDLLGLLINFILMIFVMFFCFRDGGRFIRYMMRMSPLSDEHEFRLIERIKVVSRSAIIGTLVTGVAQGVLAMIAFAIVDIDWFFWGVALGFASLIPVVGTSLIWVPCSAYLVLTGHPVAGGLLALYCVVVVGMADNFLRPYLMEGDTGLSSILIFFAIIGGIEVFGLIGVIYGPLIFGVCAVLLYIYELEFGTPPLQVGDDGKPRRRRRRRRGGRGRRSGPEEQGSAGG